MSARFLVICLLTSGSVANIEDDTILSHESSAQPEFAAPTSFEDAASLAKWFSDVPIAEQLDVNIDIPSVEPEVPEQPANTEDNVSGELTEDPAETAEPEEAVGLEDADDEMVKDPTESETFEDGDSERMDYSDYEDPTETAEPEEAVDVEDDDDERMEDFTMPVEEGGIFEIGAGGSSSSSVSLHSAPSTIGGTAERAAIDGAEAASEDDAADTIDYASADTYDYDDDYAPAELPAPVDESLEVPVPSPIDAAASEIQYDLPIAAEAEAAEAAEGGEVQADAAETSSESETTSEEAGAEEAGIEVELEDYYEYDDDYPEGGGPSVDTAELAAGEAESTEGVDMDTSPSGLTLGIEETEEPVLQEEPQENSQEPEEPQENSQEQEEPQENSQEPEEMKTSAGSGMFEIGAGEMDAAGTLAALWIWA
jgi:hypothetical protein